MADAKYPQNTIFSKQSLAQTKRKTGNRKTPIERRQDKRGLGSTREAAKQPACSIDEQHVDAMEGFSEQSEFLHTANAPLEKLTIYIPPIVKQWTQRQADRLGLSLSSFASPL